MLPKDRGLLMAAIGGLVPFLFYFTAAVLVNVPFLLFCRSLSRTTGELLWKHWKLHCNSKKQSTRAY